MILAIIGRPNVGKSTLFNRIVGQKAAIVDDISGVTRDWKILPAILPDMSCQIIDSAGLMGFEEDHLIEQIEEQFTTIIDKADVILLIVDGLQGINHSDSQIVKKIKKQTNKPIVLVANKCEKSAVTENLADFCKLGCGDPIAISAKHGIGMENLYHTLQKLKITCLTEQVVDDYSVDNQLAINAAQDFDINPQPLNIAIVGRPNVGKSTLINSLINEKRLLTGDQPGITRDNIKLEWRYKNRSLNIVDTAGMRRKAKIDQRIERLSTNDSLKVIQYAEIVVLVVTAGKGLVKQDLLIAEHVIKEGRGLLIAANKADLAKGNWHKAINNQLAYSLSQVKNIACIAISALTKKNLNKLLDEILVIEKLWNTRINTSVINQWLQLVTAQHAPPMAGGKRIRLKYMHQIKTRPPTFVIFISKPAKLLDSYLRYLLNRLREDFCLHGVPIRFQIKKGKNPYDSKKI